MINRVRIAERMRDEIVHLVHTLGVRGGSTLIQHIKAIDLNTITAGRGRPPLRAQRDKAVKLVLEHGMTCREASRKVGVCHTSVSKWVRAARQRG